ncbi:HAD family hydrolase [Sphingomonas aliaeris]|uniref:HAD family hydrolase n=1 Tax=Sphingomonas aliaeris TaxID=2759526 RepID=A0A974NS24_9SPHN|nr:HAD family hydrolase [Sphingomonas aliaeris]QQV75869.1 HAD family hydrolase [Sphingomonas aliaeris]
MPLATWLIERHQIDFPLMRGRARRLDDGSTVSPRQLSDLCELFARDELLRQTRADGAREALAAFAEAGDVVILTNIPDRHRDARVQQFAAHGMHYPIQCNQGLKGAAVARLVGDRPAVFIDENDAHHADVSKAAPHVSRLQLIADPRIADLTPASHHAHARHNRWDAANTYSVEALELVSRSTMQDLAKANPN